MEAPSSGRRGILSLALTTEAYKEIEEGDKWIETLEDQKVEAEGSLDNILEQMVERKIKQMK